MFHIALWIAAGVVAVLLCCAVFTGYWLWRDLRDWDFRDEDENYYFQRRPTGTCNYRSHDHRNANGQLPVSARAVPRHRRMHRVRL